ncbi:hypothetical protein VTO42DRAFT_8500 [Malbranchea cinnamomea]
MASLWPRRFSRDSQREQLKRAQREQTGLSWSLKLFGGYGPSKREHAGRKFIDCEETQEAQYPIYDPKDPRHNPHARKKHGTSGRWKSAEISSCYSTTKACSLTNPLRRAGATVAIFAESIRPKAKFRRSPLRLQQGITSDPEYHDEASSDFSLASSGEAEEYVQRSTGTRVVTRELVKGRTDAPRPSSAPCRPVRKSQSVSTRAVRRLVVPRCFRPFPLDHVTCQTNNENNLTLPSKFPETPPPAYSLYDQNCDTRGCSDPCL